MSKASLHTWNISGFRHCAGRPASVEKSTGQTLTELCSSRNSPRSRMVLLPRTDQNPSSGLDRTSTPVPKKDRRSASNVASSFSMGSSFSPQQTNSETTKSKTPSLCVTKLFSGSLLATEVCEPSRYTWRQIANLKSTLLVARAESLVHSVPSVSRCRQCPLCGDLLRRRHAHKKSLAEAARHVFNREEILVSN